MNWQVAAAAIGVLAMPLEPMLVSWAGRAWPCACGWWSASIYLAALVPLIRAAA